MYASEGVSAREFDSINVCVSVHGDQVYKYMSTICLCVSERVSVFVCEYAFSFFAPV